MPNWVKAWSYDYNLTEGRLDLDRAVWAEPTSYGEGYSISVSIGSDGMKYRVDIEEMTQPEALAAFETLVGA